MPLPEEAEAQTNESGALFEQDSAESMSRLRPYPMTSDVRGLSVREEVTSESHDGTVRERNVVIPPPGVPWVFDEREFGDETLPLDEDFLLALRASDSARALLWLLRENAKLRTELTSATEDFECLRDMNVSIQQQLTVSLGAADDIRLGLASEVERAKDRVLELEEQLQAVHSRLDGESAQLQAERDAMQVEIVELRGKLEER